ncbi:MAG: phosphocarrier protein HPr [Candidatus Binatia bacterium]|nr:MAG: phosphocarrier protein HPr [Candidatus Binatia bacterium]
MGNEGAVRRTFEIRNRLGLHARAAVQLVQLANRFESEIRLSKDGKAVNGKSVLELMMLAATQGSAVEVIAEGPDAQEAVEAIGALIAARFHEPE